MTDPPADVFLLPGPVRMDPRVLRAMARPAMNHRGPEFKEILADVRTLTQYVFGTKGEVAVLSGSGTAGLEAAVTEPERTATSPFVPNTYCVSVRTSARISLNSGPRWFMAGLAIARRTRGSILTGPGSKNTSAGGSVIAPLERPRMR